MATVTDPSNLIRTNLVGECVRVIKSKISRGEWSGNLRGERRISDELQVGRDTVRLALQQLEKEGVVAAATRGARREILTVEPAPARQPSEVMRIGLLSPWNLQSMPQPILHEVDRIRMALAALGGSLVVISPPWYRSSKPEKWIRELLEEDVCHAWVLLRSTVEVQRCMEKTGVSCLIRGNPHEGITLPHLDVDWEATARNAAGVLWRHGHRRVGVFTPPDSMRGVTAAVRGLSSVGENGFEVIELAEDGTVDGIVRVLEKSFHAKNPPTALIATRPRQAVTAMGWLQLQGFQVPGNVSMLSLGHEPFIDHLWPGMATYLVSPEATARRLVRRIENMCRGHGRFGGSTWNNPEFRKGGLISQAPV